MKRRIKRGFTLVEIALFLAMTGILFVGIVAGVQGSMFQQRYNDSVQSFAEFLRSIYSQVMNVENNIKGSGKSNKAIYGKLVVFGEKKMLDGKTENTDKAIFTYTVIGNADGSIGSGNVLEALESASVNVFEMYKDDSGKEGPRLAGIAEQYFPRWGAGIQKADNDYVEFKGALLIVRHPSSGTVFTYVYEGEDARIININIDPETLTSLPEPLDKINLDQFEIKDVDFCVNPEGDVDGGIRRNVRIVAGARNASGVEIIGQDYKEKKTVNGEEIEMGNRCVGN